MSVFPTVSLSGGDSPPADQPSTYSSIPRDSGDSHPTDDAQEHNATEHGEAIVQSDPTKPTNVFAEQTPRAQCIVRALNARKEALRLHQDLDVSFPVAMNTYVEVTRTAMNLFRENCSDWIVQRRENESLRQHRLRVRSACQAYIYQAVLNDTWTTGQRQTISDFWHAIMTNQISDIDRANIARYEDAVVNAQRQRTAAITPKVIKLGVCIAQAWRRCRQ